MDHAAPDAQAIPGHDWAGRFAWRGSVLLACCFGLMAVFWLLSGTSAHAATVSRTAATSTTTSRTAKAARRGPLPVFA